MVKPTITVVTPSYNQGAFLEQTLRSVLSQNYDNLEYIVIDGGSQDGSVKIIQRYSHLLDYWCSEKDKGQADALRKGFSRASGEILCWLNSDDVLLPGALHRIAGYFHHHESAEVVSAGVLAVDAYGRPLPMSLRTTYTLGYPATYDCLRFYGMHYVWQQGTFFKRSAYEAVGGVDPSLEYHMDYDLFLRLAKRQRFRHLPRLVAAFRLHEGCKTVKDSGTHQEEYDEVFRRHGRFARSPVYQRLMWWRHRIPALLNKARLLVLQGLGFVKMPEVARA